MGTARIQSGACDINPSCLYLCDSHTSGPDVTTIQIYFQMLNSGPVYRINIWGKWQSVLLDFSLLFLCNSEQIYFARATIILIIYVGLNLNLYIRFGFEHFILYLFKKKMFILG